MTPTFQGEVQLAGWSESHNGGCKVTFWLADPADLDEFRALTVRKGNTAGQRLACVLMEIGDDEQPVPESEDDKNRRMRAQVDAMPLAEKQRGGELAKLAGMWCADSEFRRWMAGAFESEVAAAMLRLQYTVTDEEIAAGIVRVICKVRSRAELDHSPEAAERFEINFRRPYMAYLRRLTRA